MDSPSFPDISVNTNAYFDGQESKDHARRDARDAQRGDTFNAPITNGVAGGREHKIQITNNDNRTIISDTSYKQVMTTLRKHIASGALHDSAERLDHGDPPKCHPDTRINVLDRIMNWVQDPANLHLFLWIFGPAGAGKTAIAGTIAELTQKLNLLAATFFFSRSAARRNTKDFLVTTLAYQLARFYPEMRPYLKAALDNDPNIFSRSLISQLQTLIILPLNTAVECAETMPITPILIIVDGLDECDKSSDAYQGILRLLFNFSTASKYPLRILVASRPEWQIRQSFSGEELNPTSICFDLDDDYRAEDDIRKFLVSEFSRIKKKHPAFNFFPRHWPPDDDIATLVRKASRQFIYASTVLRFIDCDDDDPVERLKIILMISPVGNHTPYAQLDALYSHILISRIPKENLEDTLMLLIFILLSNARKYLHVVGAILGYSQTRLTVLLNGLNALVGLSSGLPRLFMYHASFGDFLFDPSRAGRLHISTQSAHERLAISWIHCARMSAPEEPQNLFYRIRVKKHMLPDDGEGLDYVPDPGNCLLFHLMEISLTEKLEELLENVNLLECAMFPDDWNTFHRFMDCLRRNHDAKLAQLYDLQFGEWLRKALENYPAQIQPALAIFLSLPRLLSEKMVCRILLNLLTSNTTSEKLTNADFDPTSAIRALHLVISDDLPRTKLEKSSPSQDKSYAKKIYVSRIFTREIRSGRYVPRPYDYATLAIATLRVALSVPEENPTNYDCTCIAFLSDDLLPNASINLDLARLLHECWPHPRVLTWYNEENFPYFLSVQAMYPKGRDRLRYMSAWNRTRTLPEHAAWDYLERNNLALSRKDANESYKSDSHLPALSCNTQLTSDDDLDGDCEDDDDCDTPTQSDYQNFTKSKGKRRKFF